jgi:serine/threonine protein kinase
MDPERWQVISQLFDAALAREGSARARFLDEACAGDSDLRREVESLLAQTSARRDGAGLVPAAVAAHELGSNATSSVRAPLSPGTRIGPYEIRELIGRGGMGAVYRAHDSRLGRSVAIKVSSERFGERMEREARAVAALNHPNICTLHDVGPDYLVMELIEGQTLADRIKAGPVSIAEAVPIARQIAAALEAAHERGIVHRDLKPGNIALTADGTVKVLDFGLAKVADSLGPSTVADSPTFTGAATQPGTVLGTAAYMSPEQARGKPVDKRTDIWAFGVVLYELLTGVCPFAGDDFTEMIAAVISKEPDWHTLPARTPEAIRRLLRRCLRKETQRRLRDAADARLDLDEALAGEETFSPPARVSPRRVERIAWLSAVILALTVPTALWLTRSGLAGDGRKIGLVVPLSVPPTRSPDSLALSPDGLKVAFEATADGHSQVWVRFLDTGAARPLPGTENGYRPFWSPDSRSIGFFANRALNRIDIDGGGVQRLASSYRGTGGTWNSGGIIVFASVGTDRVFRIDAGGGTATALTGLDCQSPHFLPDGHRFLCHWAGDINVADLDGSPPVRLRRGELAVYGRERELLFVNQDTLFAQEFDPDTLVLSGDPQPIAEQVAAVSSSAAGDVAYRSGTGLVGLGQVVWFDRKGNAVRQVGEPFQPGGGWDLSPNGRYLITPRFDSRGRQIRIWLADLDRGVFSPFAGNGALFGFWSPDGARVIFARSDRASTGREIFQAWRATGREEALFSFARIGVPRDWSADGRYMIFETFDAERPEGADVLALPLDQTGKLDGEPISIAATFQAAEYHPQLSPNDRWVAYTSDESGVPEIYTRPFPGPGAAVPVSVGGGGQVRWRADSQELFYIAEDGGLMAVPFRAATGEPGPPVRLFATYLWDSNRSSPEYDVASDGQRFILNVAQPVSAPIWLYLNRDTRRR